MAISEDLDTFFPESWVAMYKNEFDLWVSKNTPAGGYDEGHVISVSLCLCVKNRVCYDWF